MTTAAAATLVAVVEEVLSPSTPHIDASAKLAGDFQLPAVSALSAAILSTRPRSNI